MTGNILSVKNLSKVYKAGGHDLSVLKDVSFSIKAGSTVSIVGPSGSGKTTLLALCAGLDSSSGGSIYIKDIRIDNLSEDKKAKIRSRYTGFIFQNFQLLPTLTVLENVMVPLELRGEKGIKRGALELLDKVGLLERSHHYPTQLSGGEQQRVALARAFSNRPDILFADEPTGNLDAETGEKITKLIFELNRESGTTLLLVTHDLELASRTQRIIRLKGGEIISDLPTQQISNEQ